MEELKGIGQCLVRIGEDAPITCAEILRRANNEGHIAGEFTELRLGALVNLESPAMWDTILQWADTGIAVMDEASGVAEWVVGATVTTVDGPPSTAEEWCATADRELDALIFRQLADTEKGPWQYPLTIFIALS